jgi:hypothetical protein
MNRSIGLLAFALLGVSVAACGGGGSGTSSPIPTPTATPTTGAIITIPNPSPSPSSNTTTLSGHVYMLTGPLATQGLAAPSGCAGTQACASYPTAPPASALPGPQATPVAGAPVAGVTVYVTTTAGIAVANVPTSPIATATSAADGSFTVSVSAPGTYGLYVANGSLASGSAVTSNGYAVTRTSASTGTAATVYVGALSPDEQSAFTTVNSQRVALGYAPITSDLTAQMAARVGVAQRIGAAACDDSGVAAVYSSLGGVPASGFTWEDTLGPSWSAIANYGSETVVNTSNVAFAGLAAVYQASACNPSTDLNGGPYNFFEGYALL